MSNAVLPDFSIAAQAIIIGGIYEHYKGLRYKILAIARHTETLEELVIYQALYGEAYVWARPVSMFVEDIMIDDQRCPRFKLAN